jgi:hypothetical protein
VGDGRVGRWGVGWQPRGALGGVPDETPDRGIGQGHRTRHRMGRQAAVACGRQKMKGSGGAGKREGREGNVQFANLSIFIG